MYEKLKLCGSVPEWADSGTMVYGGWNKKTSQKMEGSGLGIQTLIPDI